MSAVGVLGFTASIEAENCEITNCGKYNFAADLGGDIKVNHCTFGNDAATFTRKDPAFILSNADYVDENNFKFAAQTMMHMDTAARDAIPNNIYTLIAGQGGYN